MAFRGRFGHDRPFAAEVAAEGGAGPGEGPWGEQIGMQALKFTVIGMGLLIVAGLTLLFYGLAEGVGKLGGAGEPLGEGVVPVPEGCVIADSRIVAPYLVLRLDGLADRGCQQVVLVDLESGRVTGRVTAVSER